MLEGITRGGIQGQKRIPPRLSSIAERWPRDNRGVGIKVVFRWSRVSGSIGGWSDVNVGVWGRAPPAVGECMSW